MMVHLTRRYRFCASHRLHSDALSGDQNASLYGKCNNPMGHGHNYELEVTVAGPVDPLTGMVMNPETLDRAVEKSVLARFDHVHLNLDIDNFAGRVTTTENLCIEAFRLIREELMRDAHGGAARLERIRIEETSSNFFEYDGEP